MKMKKICSLIAAISLSVQMLFALPVQAEEGTAPAETVAAQISTNEIPGWPVGPDITSSAGVILENSSNTVLYGKNMDAPLFPGSSVKIMTMLLALENSSLSDEVTMTATGVSGVTDGGVSISSQIDEVFTMEQCMYAIMLASANDIALQVAEHVGGSVEAFVTQMNERAAQLGCKNTVFTNPTGLPDENQHTTAYDMALITQAAFANDSFRSIASAQSYTIPATNMAGGDRSLSNTFKMTSSAEPVYYADCIGGKLGFTNASGETLVCAARRGDLTLTCVVLQGASGATPIDAAAILDYGFQNFKLLNLGREDFDVLEGGIVLAPSTAGTADFSIEDTETEDGQIHRVYSYQSIPVGTAVCIKPSQEETVVDTRSEENIKAAEEYSQTSNYVPYIMIGAVGLLLLIFLLTRMIKVIKS